MSETALKQKLMVPVGRSVYTELRKDNCAYADKTALIPAWGGARNLDLKVQAL